MGLEEALCVLSDAAMLHDYQMDEVQQSIDSAYKILQGLTVAAEKMAVDSDWQSMVTEAATKLEESE